MDTDRLIENIIEQIKEAQIKLGYVKEVIRLYFPAASLSLLLQIPEESAEVLAEQLQKKSSLKDTMLGEMQFSSCKGNRVEVCILPQGAEYVHQYVKDPPFLVSIIQLFGENHHLTIEEICMAFEQFNPNYICQKMDKGMDFDYVLYFPDETPDAWYYCIRMEMGHTIYHRFSKEDYLGFGC